MHTLRNEWLILLLGDLFALTFALFMTLVVRYQSVPSSDLLALHLVPFSLLFVVSLIIFFVAGLYDKQTLFAKAELPTTVFFSQLVNVILAALLFFFVPIFTIAPKTNLVIYLFISALFIVAWRIVLAPLLQSRAKCETALIIGDSPEVHELIEEVNANDRYGFTCLSPIRIADGDTPEALKHAVAKRLASDEPTVLIANPSDDRLKPLLSHLFGYVFAKPNATFINFNEMYEGIFEKVALSSLNPEWYLEYASRPPQIAYDALKRLIDILGGLIIGLMLLILTPFIWMLMHIEGKGPFFIAQNRMGKHTKPTKIFKIRTMTSVEDGAWIGETENKVTKVGETLRRTSIDELPQVLAVLSGKLSLIGPRSDMMGLAERLQESIPYYNVRYTVAPGITGWAQTHQRYAPGQINPQSIEDSKVRLQYDLYYVKHRSLLLDISIALRTIKTLLSRLFPKIRINHG
tara:strand:- start:6050 stop:7435 length:1386 start_codon:yes stop_codon:yes gene_type:complete